MYVCTYLLKHLLFVRLFHLFVCWFVVLNCFCFFFHLNINALLICWPLTWVNFNPCVCLCCNPFVFRWAGNKYINIYEKLDIVTTSCTCYMFYVKTKLANLPFSINYLSATSVFIKQSASNELCSSIVRSIRELESEKNYGRDTLTERFQYTVPKITRMSLVHIYIWTYSKEWIQIY